ncbi:MAG: AraC family transcriptional regulator ligand-binding domain-containing protein [Marinobacter sp.]|uniref:AraC family transcriptional regulator n=1 Tax=Marinobacter sp. TaxID=50741 RepID=UPI00299F3362|nr:AraC family transcriptional regulator ligand-binding domain-containing protein [Marinobacter sp.]MDX1757940.1 AraC family transcriptional regulator ligand-binding domain-containing protein [Marinobacter sp.]
MTLEATVSIGWVNTVIAAAQRLSVDKDTLLATAGIPSAASEQERWPIDDITRLWHAAERCTGDPGFGLKVGAEFTPMSFSGVGFALQSAATLREAVAMAQRFQRLISDGGRFQVLAGNTATWLVYHPRQGKLAFSPHQIEAVLAAVVGFASWVTGARMKPLRVQFSQPRLGPPQGYETAFHSPVDFEQAFSGVLVDNEILDQPLPQADPQLAQVHTRYTTARLAALSMNSASVPELQRWLAARLGPVLPRRAEAAEALGISERTLARRLRDQGQTFDNLLDEVRRQRALQAVAETTAPLPEIAESLGFAEVSTFYRAFRRWTGLPPVRWRKQLTTTSRR